MKQSIYTAIIANGNNQHIIYNSLHDKILICSSDTIDLLKKHSDIASLRDIHPTLFQQLCKDEYFVPDEKNEEEDYIKSVIKDDDTEDNYSVTINPTMNCNLRCWYCYENHLHNTNMSPDILERIKKLFSKLLQSGKTISFHLSFFGGEPLLGFKNCVKPIILYTQSLCKEHNIKLSLGFTSNAVLLSKEIVDFLSSTNLNILFQIPFDGGRDMHNSIKKRSNGDGCYDVTLDNLKYALYKGINIIIRCNYTSKSAASFQELINDTQALLLKYRSQITFSFQKVWQDKDDKETETIIDHLEQNINRLGGSYYEPNIDRGRCYADKRHSFVINYNGDIYQCTARDFTKDNKEGYLDKNGVIQYNERYHRRMNSRFSNPECLKCTIFPICKICSTRRIESNNTKCLLSMPETDKSEIIKSRIKAIYGFNAIGEERLLKG